MILNHCLTHKLKPISAKNLRLNKTTHPTLKSLKHPLKARRVRVTPLTPPWPRPLMRPPGSASPVRRTPPPPAAPPPSGLRRHEILEHGRRMLREHLAEVDRRRLRPEEVVVERVVGVEPLLGVEAHELVEEVDGVVVLEVGAQAVAHLALLALGQLQLAVELEGLDARPDVWADGAAELGDEGELVLLRAPLRSAAANTRSIIRSYLFVSNAARMTSTIDQSTNSNVVTICLSIQNLNVKVIV